MSTTPVRPAPSIPSRTPIAPPLGGPLQKLRSLLHNNTNNKTPFIITEKGISPLKLPETVHARSPSKKLPLRVDDEKNANEKKEKALVIDPLDPATRHAAQMGPPMQMSFIGATQETAMAPHARVSMEELLPQLVRRIAWAGDRRRGTVQLELGAGRHEGTTVTVHADDGRVRIELGGRGGQDVDDLRARIDARLKRHGIDVVSVT